PVRKTVDPVGVEVELADGCRRKVRRHRLACVPLPGRPPTARSLAFQLAVGDRFQPGWDRDPEGVGRLVERMVVGGEPSGRDVWLTDDDDAIVSRNDAARTECVLDRLGDALVTDDSGEAVALRDPTV